MTAFSQPQPAPTSRQEAWQSWTLFWHSLFTISLIVATGISLTIQPSSWKISGALLGLSLLLGIWYGVCIVVSPWFWRNHILLTFGYLAIGWMLWFALTSLNPAYLLVLIGLYPQTFVLLLVPQSLIGGLILLVLSLWQQAAYQGGWSEAFFFTLGTGLAGLFLALFIHTILLQSRKRAELINQLQAMRQELAQAERQGGIMQERQRLAREIHDTFTQGFTSIVMQIEMLEAALPSDTNTITHTLNLVSRIARENLAEARRVLWALQPEAFERASLPEILVSLVERWSEESEVPASATITGATLSLRPEIEVTLLRAAQEALVNIRKHAQAHSVTLTLSYMEDMVALDVQDDGIGFEPEQLTLSPLTQTTRGFGLKALYERVQQLGGTVTLESFPGEGTTVAVALPAVSNSPLTISVPPQEEHV